MPGTEGTQTQGTEGTQAQQQTQVTGISEERVKELIAAAQPAIDKGVQQKESAVLKSFFSQQGLTEEEATAAMTAYKQSKQTAAQQEKDRVANMQKENEALKAQILQGKITTTLSAKATELGVNPTKISYLQRLADLKDVTNDKGEIDEAKIKTAIEAVLKDFPELKATSGGTGSGSGFVQVGGKGGSEEPANEALNKMRQAMGLKPMK